jgi:hypothetical protein
VAGRVDDVDLHSPLWRASDAGVLREDGDAALALEVVGVHHALGDDLVVAEGARLAEHVSTRVVLPWSTWATIAMLRSALEDPRARVSTIDLRVDYLSPGRQHDLHASATLVRVGKTVGVSDVRLFHPHEPSTTIATGKGVYAIRLARDLPVAG